MFGVGKKKKLSYGISHTNAENPRFAMTFAMGEGGCPQTVVGELFQDLSGTLCRNFKVMVSRPGKCSYRNSEVHRYIPPPSPFFAPLYCTFHTNKNNTKNKHRGLEASHIVTGDVYSKKGHADGCHNGLGKFLMDDRHLVAHDGEGIITMANGYPGRNGCQFMVLLSAMPKLNGKNCG